LLAAALIAWTLVERQRMALFRSAAGFYTLRYPAHWRTRVDGNTVSLRPPSGACELTLSAHYSPKGVADDYLREVMQKGFQRGRTLKPFRRITDRTWLGSEAEFEEERDGRRRVWIARTCALGSVGVFATANAAPEALERQRRLLERVLDSIELHPPVQVKRPRVSA
jgi:hypothetical protein